MPSGSGSRSRTGCYTCRVRKKKCDEQQPSCGNCQARSLPCYGYATPPPAWMQGKRSWKEVMLTEEARELQSVAETAYKASRRSRKAMPGAALSRPSDQFSSTVRYKGPATPDSVWWDGGVCAVLPFHRSAREDARLLKLYLDFVFPVQFTFYPMASAEDHGWLVRGLCSNTARYHAALGISACFDASLREPARTDGIGLSTEVTARQAVASSGLRAIIGHLDQKGHSPRKIARVGLEVLEVMHQLLSLEVFSMLEGTWELHHRATRALLDTLHTYKAPNSSCDQQETAVQSSSIDIALKDSSSPEIQKNFEFHVTCVVWIDIIANSTVGSPLEITRHFDYISYLRAGDLKTENIMGCHSSVMAEIAEITHLADWKTLQLYNKSLDAAELSARAMVIANRLTCLIHESEKQAELEMTKVEAGSRLVTLQFAWAAHIYLHVTAFGADADNPEIALRVGQSLEMLEALPNWLMIRVNWPFTITGCLAGTALHDRFRGLVGRMAARKQPLGMTWKGLMVMEECWRLRQSRPETSADCGWKQAMESLGKRILLV